MGSSNTFQVYASYKGKDVADKVNQESDNSNITINNGLITITSAQIGDSVTIIATLDNTSTLVGLLDKAGIIVIVSTEDGNLVTSFTATVVDIELNEDNKVIDSITFAPGESKTINANILSNKTNRTVSWSCDNEDCISL